MAKVISSRMTHDYDGDLVVFLIGMRINKPWRPDLWLPVFNAMPECWPSCLRTRTRACWATG